MNKTLLQILVIYFVVAGLLFASDWLSTGIVIEGEKVIPIMFSVALLIPLFAWYLFFQKRADEAQQMRKETRSVILTEIYAVLLLAMVVRLPSALLFGNPYEKTPLIYFIVLMVLLVKKESLGLYGFRLERLGRALLVGLAFYLIYDLSGFLVLNVLSFAYAGQLFFVSYDAVPFLLIFPFMTFCVGIGEEGLFRGFMQTRLCMVYDWKKAVYIQAVLFGLWHFVWNLSPLDLGGMAFYCLAGFLGGLVFGYFYHITGNLTSVILIHGLIDSVQFGLITNPNFPIKEYPYSFMPLIASAVSLIAWAVATKLFANKIRARPEGDN